jgi:glycosyltransferase involved in cell wall biosynthesis
MAHSGVLASYRRRFEILAERGHAVTLLTPERWTEGNRVVEFEETPPSSLRVVRSTPWGSSWPTAPLRNVAHLQGCVGRLLEETEPEVLEVFEEPYSLAAYYAFYTAHRRRPACLRLVFSAQNIHKRYPWPFSGFQRSVLSKADAAMPVDPLVEPVLRAQGLPAATPAPVVPLGIDPEHFRPVPPDWSLVPEAARAGRRVGFLGKLQPEKGVGDLVAALADLPEDTHLLIAGAGPLEAELRGAHPRAHVVGTLPQASLPGFYAACDVVAVPSRTTPTWKEQFGRVAVEAMACGAAVVVSDSGSLPHVVGGSARVAAEGDVPAWTAALGTLLTDAEARRDLGEAGRAHVLATYTWEAIADAHEGAWAAAAEARAKR